MRGRGQRPPDRRRERDGGALRVAGRWQHDGELVAPEAPERRARAQQGAQPLGDDAEQLVADVVAERVVDLLEPVEVEEQHADPLAVAGRGEVLAQPLRELDAVRQPGEDVVPGLVAQPLEQPDAVQRDREVAGERAQEGQVVGREAGAVAQAVPHREGAAGAGHVEGHHQPVAGRGGRRPPRRRRCAVLARVVAPVLVPVLVPCSRPCSSASVGVVVVVLVGGVPRAGRAVVTLDAQLGVARVQQLARARQQPVGEVGHVDRPLAAADELLEVLQGPVPPPQHEVGAVRPGRPRRDEQEQAGAERAGAEQHRRDEADRGVDRDEQPRRQQDLATSSGPTGPPLIADDEQDDAAHDEVDGGQREVAPGGRGQRQGAAVGDEHAAEDEDRGDVERVGGGVEGDLQRRHALQRGTRPRRPPGARPRAARAGRRAGRAAAARRTSEKE